MAHDRDEYNPEESEYHFSDEEVNYDVESVTETDSTPKAAPAPSAAEARAESIKNLMKSKRVLISAGVFIVLVFIVYKMLGSSATSPTEIVPEQAASQQMTASVPKSPMAASSSSAAPTTASAVMPTQTAMPSSPTTTPINAPATVPQTMANTAMPQQPQSPQPPTQQPMGANEMMAPQSAMQQNAMMPQQQPSAQPAQVAQQQNVVATMPSVIPVQSAMPQQPAYNSASPNASATAQILNGQIPTQVQSQVNNLSAASDRAMAQMQAQYEQKLNDYATQNKALQEQVQTLNARVVTMESQMTQLIQSMSKQSGANAPAAGAENNAAPGATSEAVPAVPQAHDAKLSYNVQAIIPGRAWLRSDSGETVTVAEGDTVRDLGRITKIDPYDGVVEINTGSKMISLSYGNGGG